MFDMLGSLLLTTEDRSVFISNALTLHAFKYASCTVVQVKSATNNIQRLSFSVNVAAYIGICG